MSENDSALTLDSVSYHYKSNWGGSPKPALSDISLEIKKGEVFGFLGQSGAGKTTTIKCILNLLQLSRGSIQIFNQPHTDPSSRALLGYLPERPYFYDHLTVRELLEMCGKLSGLKGSALSKRIDECLESTELAEKRNAPLHSLSKGQTQKIAMAQALISKPDLLILDEPFSGLDPLGRKRFKDLLFDLKQEGVAIFLSSHILEDIQNLCDRVSIMAGGEIRKTLSLSELSDYTGGAYELILKSQRGNDYGGSLKVLPGDSRISITFEQEQEAKAALLKALEQDDIVETYRIVQPTLEELFVKTVQE